MLSFNNIETTLNGICPYFTMFPLDFPLSILKRQARKEDTVLDPFCGRGTTNYAARLLGLSSLGVDSSPVATAITASKLVKTSIEEILEEARIILKKRVPQDIPSSDFWKWAFHPDVLEPLCILRDSFLEDCNTAPRIALRGIILGALHGPRQKTFQSYFSNQCPRTYAPKPMYAVRYWKDRGFLPEPVNILDIIDRRAKRYYHTSLDITGIVRQADSRISGVFEQEISETGFDWVITSPPYYGMRTYLPDQWLRNWFVGGSASVDYSASKQLIHSSPEDFTADLRKVWNNVNKVCSPRAKIVVRFGGISDRNVDPLTLIKNSFNNTKWRISTVKMAGNAKEGKRQADTFLRNKSTPILEYDVWAIKEN